MLHLILYGFHYYHRYLPIVSYYDKLNSQSIVSSLHSLSIIAQLCFLLPCSSLILPLTVNYYYHIDLNQQLNICNLSIFHPNFQFSIKSFLHIYLFSSLIRWSNAQQKCCFIITILKILIIFCPETIWIHFQFNPFHNEWLNQQKL